MSKFIDDAFWTDLKEKRIRTNQLTVRLAEMPDPARLQTAYRITAKLEEYGWVNEYDSMELQNQVKEELLKLFRRKMYHEIFGSFTASMFRLEKALHEEDYANAKDALSEMWKEIKP